MKTYLSAILLSVTSVLARAVEMPAETPPPPDADPTAIIGFVLIMVGMICGYVWYIWHKERQRKQDQPQDGHRPPRRMGRKDRGFRIKD